MLFMVGVVSSVSLWFVLDEAGGNEGCDRMERR